MPADGAESDENLWVSLPVAVTHSNINFGTLIVAFCIFVLLSASLKVFRPLYNAFPRRAVKDAASEFFARS